MTFPSFKRLFVSAHFLALACLLAFFCLPFTWPVSFPVQFWIKQGLDYLMWASLLFGNSLIIVPRVLFKGKTGLFVIIVLASIIAALWLDYQFTNLLRLPVLMEKTFHAKKDNTAYIGTFINVIIALIIFGISTVIAVVQKIQHDRQREQNLEKEKIASELSFLKTQINPHFFFNVLHTIYALIDTNIQLAKDSVYTLSHMMRYVLYDTKPDMTTLQKEVTFVEDYIKLMQLRLTDQTQVIFDKPGQLKDIPLAPMLLLPFVENAFKHGISTIHPSYIYIGLHQSENVLQIEVRNSIFNEKADNLEESNGIGLINTQRRLNLLYPGKHELTVERNETANEFTVKLKLALA